ncbi:hypothetical protein [Pelagicoccus albus]|uniref:Uncharacterized protein n=1 Tax=Pelagicoccus albus TaxID=415222 RepID=A0A7X1B375_9BACT|nr:hypothetical protein [Pelagicoccus albus]MBC2604808.1 hypothetical protein [Pelagicoccus albus]
MIPRTLILFLLVTSAVKATEQQKELINYCGRLFYIFIETPYDSYEEKKSFESRSTALWRGYVGEWLIEDRKLYMRDVHLVEADLEDFFEQGQKIDPKNGVFASWYSGTLTLCYGEYYFEDEEGGRVALSNDFEITIENGTVTEVKKLQPFQRVEWFLEGRDKIEKIVFPEEKLAYAKSI